MLPNKNGLRRWNSITNGRAATCGTHPRSSSGATRVSVSDHALGSSSRSRKLSHVTARPPIVIAQYRGVRSQLVVPGEPARERLALVAEMLRHHRERKAKGARCDRLFEQSADAIGFAVRCRASHCLLAHHPMAKRRERGHEADVDADAAAFSRIHVIGEGFPVPRESAIENLVWN